MSVCLSVCLSVCPGIFRALPGQIDFQLESVTSGQTQTQKKRKRKRGGDKNRVRCGYNGVRRVPLRMWFSSSFCILLQEEVMLRIALNLWGWNVVFINLLTPTSIDTTSWVFDVWIEPTTNCKVTSFISFTSFCSYNIRSSLQEMIRRAFDI
jgi:hypothetical protein